MDDNKDNQEQIKNPEKGIPASEQPVQFEREGMRTPEKKELSREDEIVSSELRKEIEMMELDENTKGEAEKKAEKIGFLDEEEKIKHLLKTAREKGLIFAIQVAKKMHEPYLLDILHDTLAREGFYKDFTK